MLEQHVAEGIHRVEDARANWYIVEDGDELTVVDAGLPKSWDSLHSALKAIGRKPGDIGSIVLTHGHFDHVGFAERARTELGVPVWAPEGEEFLAAHPWRYDHERSRLRNAIERPQFIPIFLQMGIAGALWVKGVQQVRSYPHTGSLDVAGRPEVVFTPGHTSNHCALHFPQRGALIAGDAIVTFDVYTARGGPQIVSGTATADSSKALASLDALDGTGAQHVLTGHGPAWTQGVGPAVERARSTGPH